MRLDRLTPALISAFAICARAVPEPRPEPEANPEALAEAQTWNNNAPFSGAIYIVSPDGQPAQGSCPAEASLSCGDQGHPSWCCPGGCSCVQQQGTNGYIGCCPAGSNCAGPVPVQTVTVTAQAQQTVAVVHPQDYTTTTTAYHTSPPPAAGFCQTLTMHGPGLPRVTQGQCGTILIVEEGSSQSLKTIGIGAVGVLLMTQLAVARIFRLM